MRFDHSSRISLLQARMVEVDVDAVLLSIGADLPYFTGYEATPSERLTVLVVPRNGDPVMFVPQLEAPRVDPRDFELHVWGELDDPVELAAQVVDDPSRVAVGDQMWSAFLTRFQKVWAGTDWIPASDLTRDLRIRKDPAEVELLRRAAHGVDRVMQRMAADVVFGGRTEREVARDLADLTVAEGHDEPAFTIVASGPNGASPHHHPADRTVTEGDLVVCDFGGRIGGYFSDSTRTFVVGEPTKEQLDVHEVVARANQTGHETARPGVECQEVDRVVRSVVDDAGYGEFFVHRTGHGIGLEVHEHPYIVEGSDMVLEQGMTFSIEPGVYLPGRFGIRIEDIVACTEDGVESLNQAPRGLMTVA